MQAYTVFDNIYLVLYGAQDMTWIRCFFNKLHTCFSKAKDTVTCWVCLPYMPCRKTPNYLLTLAGVC